MADFLINSLRGGLNEDPPNSIGDDQCTRANNVEWVESMLGERRRGANAIDLTGAGLSGYDRVVWSYRHLPSDDPRDAQLWVLAINDPSTATFLYKDSTGWHTVVPDDAISFSFVHQVVGQTLHGKLFIAYKSAVDRLHVWDGTSLRRVGLAEPSAAPTAADTAPAGSYTGTRYFRVRWTTQVGGTTILRSEPSDTLTFSPNGSKTGATVTRPTISGIDADVTHWELEEAVDNANFYVVATTAIGTSTATDTTALTAIATSGYSLSEDIGDYELVPSVRYLTADEDRLVGAGSFEDEAFASRVIWTPVFGDPGTGNDERIPVDTVNFRDLDNYEGGGVTGISAAVSGYIFVSKMSHLHQMTRSGVRTKAYEFAPLTKERGALEGSMVTAFDAAGNPTLFALDPDIGPIRFGPRGVEPCGLDIKRVTWESVNIDATTVKSRGCYFKEKQQIHWWVPTGSSNVPDTRLVLHTRYMRETEDGLRGGWAIWTGPSAAALTVTMFSTNVDSMGSGASNVLAPIIGIEGSTLLWLTDEDVDDNGTAFAASIVTKPYVHGNLLHQFKSQNGALMAKAATGALLDVKVIADFGLVEKEVVDVDLTPSAHAEEWVIRKLDNLSLSECKTLQVEFSDVASPTAGWSLQLFGMKETKGQTS